MTRRMLVCILFSVAPLAAASPDVTDLVARMAAGLSEDNVSSFLKPLDPAMKNYADLAANVRALVAQVDVASSVEIYREEGSTIELDWMLDLKRKGDDQRTVRRRQIVKITVEQRGKKWIVTSLEPVSFFAPPDFR